MLVRARVKDRTEWPEWATCCLDKPVIDVDMVVDLSNSGCGDIIKCGACGRLINAPEKFRTVLMTTGPQSGRRTPFILLDLDEGPLEAA